jgi:hypothetical protein
MKMYEEAIEVMNEGLDELVDWFRERFGMSPLRREVVACFEAAMGPRGFLDDEREVDVAMALEERSFRLTKEAFLQPVVQQDKPADCDTPQASSIKPQD